ncbi:MAG: DUF302 domain-containing protein [Gemmatimonadota bacterium]
MTTPDTTGPVPRPPYALKRTVALPFAEAEQRVREALGEEGFGVLTEIDVQETLRKKLDVDHRPYRILGACNPPLAYQALSSEIDVGLLLPCNVIVYEGDEPGTSVVAALDPVPQLGVAGNETLDGLAADVRARMERVLAALE